MLRHKLTDARPAAAVGDTREELLLRIATAQIRPLLELAGGEIARILPNCKCRDFAAGFQLLQGGIEQPP